MRFITGFLVGIFLMMLFITSTPTIATTTARTVTGWVRDNLPHPNSP